MGDKSKHKINPCMWRIGWPFPLGPRVEDPIRVSQFSKILQSISWENENIELSMKKILSAVSDLAGAELRYYYSRRVNSRRLSELLRFTAWLFGTIGILVPVIAHILHDLPANFLSWGYFFFALAGSVLVADKVFISTHSHQRYVKTQLEIERLHVAYTLGYQYIFVENNSKEKIEVAGLLLLRSVQFLEQMYIVLGVETERWEDAMDLAKLELEKYAKR